tara:strand:+ start:1061 stop:1240 length:180 start_codon:yes stop_codon:yes gene_type:complete
MSKNEEKLKEYESEIKDINSMLDDLTMRKAKLLFAIKQLQNDNLTTQLRLNPKNVGGIS